MLFATGCSRQPTQELDDAVISHSNDLVFEVDDQSLALTRRRAEAGNADAQFLLVAFTLTAMVSQKMILNRLSDTAWQQPKDMRVHSQALACVTT